MRHAIRGRKLGRTSTHRLAMFRNMVASLIDHGRIETTLAKAKELRSVAEKLVTKGKVDTVHSRRVVRRWLPNRDHVTKLFDDIGPRFADRPGGYTRITKLGPRQGDKAEIAIIEFVDFEQASS